MHSRIAELFEHLDRERATLDAAIATVPSALRSTPQAADRWSVAQVVQHLITVERRITGLVTLQIAGAKSAGIGREMDGAPILATIDTDKFIDRSTKLVFGGDPPSASIDADTGLRALDAARTEFKAAVLHGDGLDLSGVSAPHRAFGSLNMYEWIALVGSHMTRHAEQIREIGATLSAPKPS